MKGDGIVYKARDLHLDRAVAIKVLPPHAVNDPERKRRFVQEAKAASALNHPNIVTVHDITSDRGCDFMVMEYLAGNTLDRLIGPKGLPPDEALKYAAQIASALAAAHAAGIVHRDLKPANIMVVENGLVKMGIVYGAKDTRLDRHVAIKSLPDIFAEDPSRMARFEREAKILATLNHPNIASIHGLEESDGKRFLVLELVEGKTLAERLKKGRIPLDETLEICHQIAVGLEAAHEKGIIHRDLKPSNIKLTPEGKVKILDFGLAKAFHPGPGAEDLSQPHADADSMTATGVILGTAAYMSPEQAKGKPVNRRTDIWGFGCLLYECLAGRKVFHGETVTETVAAILKTEPDWSVLPAKIPPRIVDLIRRCLRKDAGERLRDIGDASIEIREALKEPLEAVQPTAAGLHHKPAQIGLVLVVVLLLGAVGGSLLWRSLASNAEIRFPVMRTSISLSGWGLDLIRRGLAISPDGANIVFSARRADHSMLYIRTAGEWEPRPLKGTERAMASFFSPDGEWIAFSTEKGLQRIPVRGGPPQLICKLRADNGGSWGADGRIIFGKLDGTLAVITADGGTPQSVTRLSGEMGSIRHMWPAMLPGGNAAVVTVWREGHASIAAVSVKTGEIRPLVETGSRARYIQTGHLIYESEGHLVAVPFDPERLETRGASRVVIDDVGVDHLGNAAYDISTAGTLVYTPASASLSRLVWKDRSGNTTPLKLRPRNYSMPVLSPDGHRFIDTIQDGPARNLWIGNVEGEPLTRLTFGNDDWFSLFTPDSRRVLFTGGKNGRYNLYLMPVGSGKTERITDSVHPQKATSWRPDGKLLLYNEGTARGEMDIMQMEPGRPETARPLVSTPFNEIQGMFSPDGRWVAYTSNESGAYEVYLQAYPASGTKTQVSIDGGWGPAWNPKGGELFYQAPTAVMAVRLIHGVPAGSPAPLFAHTSREWFNVDWDVAPDGQRFLVAERSPNTQINIVSNWFEELNRLCPTR